MYTQMGFHQTICTVKSSRINVTASLILSYQIFRFVSISGFIFFLQFSLRNTDELTEARRICTLMELHFSSCFSVKLINNQQMIPRLFIYLFICTWIKSKIWNKEWNNSFLKYIALFLHQVLFEYKLEKYRFHFGPI